MAQFKHQDNNYNLSNKLKIHESTINMKIYTKIKFLLIVESQLINTEGIMELENAPFVQNTNN